MKITENKTDLRNISEWGEIAIGRHLWQGLN